MSTKTYADKAKSIMNKYKRRLGENFDKGDVLALEAMNQELSALREEQEVTRLREVPTTPDQSFQGGGVLGPESLDLSRLMPRLGNLSGHDTLRPTNNPFTAGSGKKGLSFLSEGDDFKSRVPWLGMASGIAGNLLMNRKVDLPTYKHEDFTPTKASANLVNYGREREQIGEEKDLATNILMGQARGMGSQAGLMENIQAGVTGTQRVAGEQFGRSLENEGNINAQILNETSRFNAAQRAQAQEMNMRSKLYGTQMERENVMIDAERRDARTQGIMDSIIGYGRDRMKADQYDRMLQIATPDDYRIEVGKDSKLRKLFGISPTMKRFFTNPEDLTSENGGQLPTLRLFGDDEYEKIMLRANRFKKKK